MTKFVKKSFDKSGQKQYFECHGYGHIAHDYPNKKKKKESKILTVTWSDSDKEDDYENVTAFAASAYDVIETSSKP